jgi:polar amino acid transport system substrate-binding protein
MPAHNSPFSFDMHRKSNVLSFNGYSLLQKEFDESTSHFICFHPKPLSETTGHLAFARRRKNSENLLRIFNQGLAILKKEGSYDKFTGDLLAGKYSQ